MSFSWLVAPKGDICVACLSANLALKEFFQTINFHFTRTTEHRPTRNLHSYAQALICSNFSATCDNHKIREYSHSRWPTFSLFWTTFTANLSIALSSSCPAWSISPIAGFPSIFIDKHELLNVNFAMFELTPRLLPTFRAWLLSTRLFRFNGGSIMAKKFQLNLNGVFWTDNLEKSDQDHFKLNML